MAQNITLLGATYSAVPSVLLPKSGGGTASFTDVTGTTATASDVASGKIFFAADGTQTTGTASGGGGGSSSWTLVASTSYQVSTTSTSAAAVATWATGHSEIWTSAKMVCVCIRDTAGKRAGYFYGSDTFFANYLAANGSSTTSFNACIKYIRRFDTSSSYMQTQYVTTSGYGVYADYLYSDGGIRIRSRYNSSYSLTVNSTYSVKVYLLDPPSGVPFFE